VTTYEPGTVAMVTDGQGRRCKAFLSRIEQERSGSGPVPGPWWVRILPNGLHGESHQSTLSDITPLVCIEATREDADDFEDALDGDSGMPGAFKLSVIVHAIRQQTPEPESPKWTAEAITNSTQGGAHLMNPYGGCEGTFSNLAVAKKAADALNAAEPTL
jgi:hypothetical protein